MNTVRKVDLVHVFNSAGVSALSESFYTDTIAELIKENESLKRQLDAAHRRLNGEISPIRR